jgi:hypothetical protein
MDLALITRLASDQLLMDTTTALTKGFNPLEAALLTVVPLADLGLPTLILREQEHGYLVQMRHRSGETHAHLAVLAPAPVIGIVDTPWVQLVEAAVRTAVQRGATSMIAEIPETATAAIDVVRQVGFVVYTRQTIFCREAARIDEQSALRRIIVRPAQPRDKVHSQLLYTRLVPGMIQQAYPPTRHPQRSVLNAVAVYSRDEARLLGYLSVDEGRSGLLVTPLLHPDVYDEAAAIIHAALQFWPKAERLPLYFRVASYQEWLATPLQDAGFQMVDRQVLFVKHMAVRVKAPFESVLSRVDKSMGKLVGNWDIKIR